MDFGPTRQHIAFQVHLTWRAARKALLSAMSKDQEQVAPGAYSIPILIGLNPGITPMQIASALSLDASKVALFLRDLVGKGLVERTRSPSDGRVVELRLTSAGEAFALAASDASDKLEAPFEGILSADEKQTLITLLEKLRAGVG